MSHIIESILVWHFYAESCDKEQLIYIAFLW